MEKLLINTPQNVQIEYQLASFGTRFLALAIDYFVMLTYGLLINYFASKAGFYHLDTYLLIGLMFFLLLPVMLYHLVLESFLRGQTVGKIIMKIKVVKLDGGRASIYEYFTRWAMNLIDIWIMSGVIGMLAIILSKQSQRVGDMAAGTAVISLKPRLTLNQTVYEQLAATYQPVFAEFEIRKLSDRDVNLIKQSFEIAKKSGNPLVFEKLRDKIVEVTGADIREHQPKEFIETVLKDHYHYHKDL